MVQQTIDSKFSEYGMGNSETDLPTGDKQLPVAIKKTVLRDLQNNNIITVPNSNGNSPLLKDRGPITDTTKLSGTKRASPECPESPSQHYSPNNNSPNGHLVYVRRKSEAELGKSSTCDSANINTNSSTIRQLGQQQETTQPTSQIKEPKVSCFPAIAPFTVSSSMIPSGKPSVPPPPGKSGMRLASAESDQLPVASGTPAEPTHQPRVSAAPTLDNLKALRNLHWEDRYYRLQLLLKKLDQSQQEEYVKMLRSLSSVELSRHAVELEKRSIQLSLEEGIYPNFGIFMLYFSTLKA
ncbi:hypothetical protein L484_006580 [Morus notabilis]|uniref:Uncharacterized protein n=1 Tax=Morus notabilis TaxID=981085 RepID=W9S8P2_9ROSA|nr:hypothetical protein L484_006580 [Morus notabilis]